MWSLLRSLLSAFGLKGDVADVYPREDDVEKIGTDGVINAGIAVVRKGDRLVLAVDCDFGDMPTWVEFDADVSQFSIAQNSGAVAHLSSTISEGQADELKILKKLMLVSNMGEEKVAHHVPFVVRSAAA